jgi:phage terminase large subunit
MIGDAITDIELLPPQKDFLLNANTYSLFSGGFGSGKTVALVLKAILLSQMMPGNFGLIGRLTYPELRDTTQKTFFEFCPPDWYAESNGGVWNKSENYIRLYNGSEIIFRHLDTISEKELLSLNLGFFGIDQAEEISESVFHVLQSRLRRNNIPRRYGFLICNPAGHNWLWNRFHPESKERMRDSHYVESTTYDNKRNLPEDYIKHMEDSYSPEMVKRFLYGSWDVFEGQVFVEFDKKVHVIDPFEIPEHWEKLVSIDHGLVNPTAVLFGAIDQDGNIFIFDEHYQAERPVSYHADIIKKRIEGQKISLMVIDPSTTAKTREKDGFPFSVLQEYNDYGIFPVPGNNDVSASINRIKEFLKVNPTRFNPRTGKKGSPQLFFFRNCEYTISELNKYHWKKMRSLAPRNPLEQTTDIDDHTVDALRYMIMSRWPSTPRAEEKLQKRKFFDEDEAKNPMTKGFSENGDEILGQFYAE